ncbi:MAG: hypothetical protein ABF518_06575 [Liquorilactobacillus ghanensis]
MIKIADLLQKLDVKQTYFEISDVVVLLIRKSKVCDNKKPFN